MYSPRTYYKRRIPGGMKMETPLKLRTLIHILNVERDFDEDTYHKVHLFIHEDDLKQLLPQGTENPHQRTFIDKDVTIHIERMFDYTGSINPDCGNNTCEECSIDPEWCIRKPKHNKNLQKNKRYEKILASTTQHLGRNGYLQV